MEVAKAKVRLLFSVGRSTGLSRCPTRRRPWCRPNTVVGLYRLRLMTAPLPAPPTSPKPIGAKSGLRTRWLSPAVVVASSVSGTVVRRRATGVLDVVISDLSMTEIGRRFDVRAEGGPTGVEG